MDLIAESSARPNPRKLPLPSDLAELAKAGLTVRGAMQRYGVGEAVAYRWFHECGHGAPIGKGGKRPASDIGMLAEDSVYTAEYVRGRLDAAGLCFSRMACARILPAGLKAAWPAVVRAFEDMWPDPDKVLIIRPSAAAITEMDVVMFNADSWLTLLGEQAVQTRRLFWARLMFHPLKERPKHSYKQLERVFGLDKDILKHRFMTGVERITYRLNSPSWIEPRGSHLP